MSLILPGGPQFKDYESNVPATPGFNPGVAVSHGGVAHTKSSYTQLIAATSFDASLVVVTLSNNSVSNGDSSTLLDVGIGAAASESVLIPDLMAGWLPQGSAPLRHYILPLYVPSGSRLSARTQSVRTTGDVTVLIQLYGTPRDPGRWWCGTQVTAYGPNAANSAGTKLTPGDSGAEGTGVLLGTTSADHDCLVLGVQGHPDDVSWSTLAYHLDVGIDSSSTQWLSADPFVLYAQSSELCGNMGVWWPVFAPIPSGTELMVRAECSGTADALSAALYGVS